MPSMPQVLTANLLQRGEVVYWDGRGWVPSLGNARVMPDPEAEEALKGAAAWVEKREVVGAYLFEVRVKDGVTVPMKQRELIRAAGPSVRADLGKQAH
jgi:uncharacterized protein DUF2849